MRMRSKTVSVTPYEPGLGAMLRRLGMALAIWSVPMLAQAAPQQAASQQTAVQPQSQQPQDLQQQPGGTTFKLQTNVRLVLLDIVVTDKKGNVVTDLKPGDFTVLEDGVQQRVRSFEPPSSHLLPRAQGMVVKSSADLGKIGSAPITILVLDELNTSFEDMAYARERIEKYLNAQPAILRQPTTLLVATNTKFEVMEDFTQDRAALLEALHKHMPEMPWKMKRSGAGSSGAFERMGQSLNSLYGMATAFSGVPGRKTVIWVGKGFPSVDLTTTDGDSTILLQNAIKRLTDAMLRSRITLYTIDPASQMMSVGVIADPDDLEDYESRSDGQPFSDEIKFSTLAPATGGRAFFSRNDIDAEVASSVDQGSNYFTLSYSPSNSSTADAKYRQIRIKLTNPNLSASTRDGYYAQSAEAAATDVTNKPPKATKEELEAEMGRAALAQLPYDGLMATLENATAGMLKLGVVAGGMQWTAQDTGKTRAEITVMEVAFGKNDKPLAHESQELSAEVMGQIQNPTQKAYFLIPEELPPGTARIRVVVRDAVSGKIGTADFKP
jgi:VWFA-related protein